MEIFIRISFMMVVLCKLCEHFKKTKTYGQKTKFPVLIFSTHFSTEQCQLPEVLSNNLDNQQTNENPMKEHNMAKKGARTKTPKASLKHVQYPEPPT